MTFSLLQGLRVVELGESVSAPYCSKLLADMGAGVVKIERPGVGDQNREYGPFLNDQPHHERSGLFLYLNANKQGVTLDLETPTGREILGGLLAKSQVFVHNLHPTEMDRLSVDYETLRTHNEQLVMASITPFGLTGPYRNYKAYDINLAAAGGICEGLGSPDRNPLTFGTPEVGYFAAMAAASSIVIALLAGGGQHIDIAEVESMAGIYNGPEALMAVYQWRMTRRTGHHALDFPYPNCILRCKDGYIFVGSPEGRQWRTLLEVMGDPEWAKEERFRNRTRMNNEYADEVDGYMEEWLLQHTKAELLALALEHRVPLAPVRDFEEVRNDESLANQFVTIDRPDTGPISYAGPPYKLSGQDVLSPSPAPLLGQHNADVYCDGLGYTKEELVKLYQTGII
ncbi:MAG: CoA transferase [SAR202 cluster bacterium]|nr:CoA transferase [Dehalococcoidia bacterium]MQF89627.1 CoA transferase [SAR202 cluster bacterium]